MAAKTIKEYWQLCQTDQKTALNEARSRSSSWGRCQDLSKVAWFTENRKDFEKIIKEALKEAAAESQPNRRVTVACWPVSALAERHHPTTDEVVAGLLVDIAQEAHPVRRSDALLMLLEAAYKEKELRKKILAPLLAACMEGKSWKSGRALKYAALVFALDDRKKATEIIELISDPQNRRQAEKHLAERRWLGPHRFMPHYEKVDAPQI